MKKKKITYCNNEQTNTFSIKYLYFLNLKDFKVYSKKILPSFRGQSQDDHYLQQFLKLVSDHPEGFCGI